MDGEAMPTGTLENMMRRLLDLTKVIEARPKDTLEAYRQRGLDVPVENKRYAKAADDFRKVLKLKPNDADAKSRLNYARQKLERQLPTPSPASGTARKSQTHKSVTATPSTAQVKNSPE